MKKYIKQLFLVGILSLSGVACSDYLSDAPDNMVTIDKVFEEPTTTLRFLANVYSYVRPMYQWSNESIWTGVSDELDVTYPDYHVSKINLGAVAPNKEELQYGNYWTHYYAGIRAATIFMQNVDRCEKLVDSEGRDLRPRYKAQARALRAWFYFCIARQYGPIVVVGEDLLPADASVAAMQIERKSMKGSFEYIVNEMDSVIQSGELSKFRPTAIGKEDNIKESETIKNAYGEITEVVCHAIKARALLYASSDFYNRDRTLPLFKDFKNVDGTPMFDYSDADRLTTLNAAKKATEDLFTEFPRLKLNRVENSSGVVDPYQSYQFIFQKPTTGAEWNDEVIYARPKGNMWEQDMSCSPRVVGGWSGWGATQEIVDAYFTKTGYPLLKDAQGNLYAEDGSYVEEGKSSASGDNGYTQKNTYKMYTNREPRFYMSICFNNSKWLSVHNQSTVEFFYGGNTGRTEKETRNYSQTGYLCRKFVNPQSNVPNNTVEHAAIMIRLGEFYLNYAEILNEIDYSSNRTTILQYLNAIRERAGIPIYGNNTGDVPVPKNYEDMKDAIRRERRVELAFEEHRYFDCIRWGIAHQEFNGPKHGMNVNDFRGEEYFYKRTVFEERVFPEYNLLWPIPLSDIYKGKKLVQNPGWSSIKNTED